MSRGIGIACRRSSEWLVDRRLWRVETSSCHHGRARRPVAVRGRPRLRCFAGLDQPAHGPLPNRGRGRVRAAVTCAEDQSRGDPSRDRRGDSASPQTAQRVGLDAGADTIGWHLQHRHGIRVSRASINRILVRAGTVSPDPSKRPKSSYIRFEAELPNETWQSDFTHYRLDRGTDAEILTWLDDHSRYALSVTAHHRVTGPVVLATFRKAVAAHGVPASTLTNSFKLGDVPKVPVPRGRWCEDRRVRHPFVVVA